MEERDRLKKQLLEIATAQNLSTSFVDKMKREMKKLKAKRKEKKLSLRTVAERMGISKTLLGYFESGERTITEEVIEDYRAALKGAR